jgi:FKBP-type peptidyl-prolyl cis-trans isomerase FkpA
MKVPSCGVFLGLVLQLALPGVQVLAQAVVAPPSGPAGAPDGGSAPSPGAITLPALSAIGSSVAVSNHLDQLGWSEAQIDAFVEGIRAALHGKPYPFNAAAQEASNAIGRQVEQVEARDQSQEFAKPGALERYLKDICKQMGLQQSDSGLCYGIKYGVKGIRPGPEDTVVVSCSATAADGKTQLPQLSNPNARGKVSTMLPGFMEGLQMMTVGSEAIFVLPPALSFGEGAWPQGVQRGSPLIFRIGLKEVNSN